MKEPRCRGDASELARSHTKISLIQTLSCDGKDVAQTFERGIDFIARCRAPKAEPDRSHSRVGRDAHRLQNRRQLDASGMTRRSRGGRHAIEPRQYLAATRPTKETFRVFGSRCLGWPLRTMAQP